MKKFIVGLVATVMVSAGLVASSGASAVAAPYPGTVRTATQVAAFSPKPHTLGAFVKVQAADGSRPKGQVRFTLVSVRGQVKNATRSYSGHPHKYYFKHLKAVRWNVLVTFVPRNGSKWAPSTGKSRTVVKGGKHRH